MILTDSKQNLFCSVSFCKNIDTKYISQVKCWIMFERQQSKKIISCSYSMDALNICYVFNDVKQLKRETVQTKLHTRNLPKQQHILNKYIIILILCIFFCLIYIYILSMHEPRSRSLWSDLLRTSLSFIAQKNHVSFWYPRLQWLKSIRFSMNNVRSLRRNHMFLWVVESFNNITKLHLISCALHRWQCTS